MSNVQDSQLLSALDKAETVEGMISFAAGMPAPELFPVEDVLRSNEETLRNESDFALQYGPVEGHPPLTELLTKRVLAHGIKGTPENLLVTSGSQQALDFMGKLFIGEGDTIIVEDPTYLGALSAFEPYVPNYVTVPMDEDGVRPDALEAALTEHPETKFIYLIPDFQNPTGRRLSVERRKAVLKLAQKFNVPIIEDAAYIELCFEGEKLPPIKSFDTDGHVIHLGTLSKIFCPGFRIGFIFAEKEVIERCVAIKIGADLQTSLLLQRQAANFLKSFDMDSHIAKLNALYRKRRDVMIDAFETYLPKGAVSYTRPNGGLFLWMSFPDGISSMDLIERFLKEKVSAIPGESFFPYPPEKAYCRFNFSFMPEDKIEEGVRRLSRVVKALL
ncbi:PLP-dependent aminotransferase family protein [Oscillospiraceae bacterium OttesenSCG-928-G22]|nr:PLP-dependent aminotransferase family protein [Oscillospiraceae bacterium OttesenSCG-928-G22]